MSFHWKQPNKPPSQTYTPIHRIYRVRLRRWFVSRVLTSELEVLAARQVLLQCECDPGVAYPRFTLLLQRRPFEVPLVETGAHQKVPLIS